MKLPAIVFPLRKTNVLLLAALLVTGTSAAFAQSAVSNLNQGGSPGSIEVGNGSGMTWNRVFMFTTGASASSFNFTGATIAFSNASGAPTLSVGLYSAFDATTHGGTSGLLTNLSLASGNPLTAGNAVFTGTATLLPSTTYYLSLSAGSPAVGNTFNLPVTSAYGEDAGGLPGWTIANNHWDNYTNFSVSPTEWWTLDPTAPRFSIQASAIPEPSTYAAIAGVAMLGLAMWQRRRKVSVVAGAA
jgi:hypothetical protein